MTTQLVEQQRTSAGQVERLLVTSASVAPPILPNQHTIPPKSFNDPDVVTSPLRADGLGPCTGLMIMLTADGISLDNAATPATDAGLTLTMWIRNPVTEHWGATAPITLPLNTWARTFDCNGGDLYFTFDPISFLGGGAPGLAAFVDIHVVEL